MSHDSTLCLFCYIHLHVAMTKKTSDNNRVSHQMSAGAGVRGGAQRGGGGGGVRGQRTEGEVHIVPVLERLRPRRLKAVSLTSGIGTKLSSSKPKNRKEQEDKDLIDPLPNELVSPPQKKELESSNSVESSINSTNDGSVEHVSCSTTSDDTIDTAERSSYSTSEGVGLNRGEGNMERGKEGGSEQLVPHVPKLRRTHAICVSNEAVGVKGGMVNSSNDPDDLSSTPDDLLSTGRDEGLTQSKATPSCPVEDTAGTGVIKTKRIQRKRGRSHRTAPPPSPLFPNTDMCTATPSCTPSPSDGSGAAEDSQTSKDEHVDMCVTDSLRTSVVEDVAHPPMCDSTDGDEWEYPQPSTNYQRMQRQLARQKQLEEMRAREAAYAREERLLRRQGLSKSPEKSKRKHLTWKDESELVEVFSYSPCSSRGSTLEPDDTPE